MKCVSLLDVDLIVNIGVLSVHYDLELRLVLVLKMLAYLYHECLHLFLLGLLLLDKLDLPLLSREPVTRGSVSSDVVTIEVKN